ncbi:hypothetical protein D3C76_875410 [compost metagenome]
MQLGEHRALHQLAVQRRHAVDAVRAEERQVAHAHPTAVVFLDQRHRPQHVEIMQAFGAQGVDMVGVDQVDDLHVPGQHALHQRHRPRLERLGQQGVVGVGQGPDRHFPGFVPGDLVLIDQQPHQLGHGNRGVGIVELDGGGIGQVEQAVMHVQVASQQVLQRGRDEEVLLAQAQLLAGFSAVGRIQHSRDAFGSRHFGHRAEVITRIEALQVQLFQRPCAPQAQGIDAGTAPADYWRVISHRPHRLAGPPDLARLALGVDHGLDTTAEADRVDHLGTLELPRVAEVQPVLGLLLLPAVDHRLPEQAVLVADAVTVGGNAQGRHALHEARRQTAQATIAERCIRFQQADSLEIDVQPFQGLARNIQQAQVAQAVIQQPTNEKFQGKVIDPLLTAPVDLTGVIHPVIDHVIARGEGDGFEPVMVEGMLRVLADRVGQLVQHSSAEIRHLGVPCFGFLGHMASSSK